MNTMEWIEDFSGVTMSEKLDGVQGIWDGQTLRTRTGNMISAPDWWTSELPPVYLVGELWTGRGQFDLARSIVCRKTPGDEWQSVRFMVFSATTGPDLGQYAEYVPQIPATGHGDVARFLAPILAGGGEGVVLRFPDGSTAKVKPHRDDDGEVIGFTPGTGRNKYTFGAITVRLRNGVTVNVNVGGNTEIRNDPPAIGAIIQFRHDGYFPSGKPRNPRYIGTRAEDSLDF